MVIPRFDPSILIQQISESIIVLDEQNVVVWLNQACEKLFGQKSEDLIGKFAHDIFVFQDSNLVPKKSETKSNRTWGLLNFFNNTVLHVQYAEHHINPPGTSAVFKVIVFCESTEEHLFIQRLKRAKEDAEQASRARTTFLANMSHELRTPLNSIMGMTDLALDLARNPEQNEYLTILKVSAESLLQLISSLLDYVKLENGKYRLRDHQFRLGDFIDDTMASLAVQCHAKGLGLYVNRAPDLPEQVRSDQARLRQILVNLINNAIKFTDKGEISISVRSSRKPENPGIEKFYWTVTDTGIGMDVDHLHRIFEPFVQIDGSATRNAGGTGIGLSITKNLVELMGGSIEVHSHLGQGSSFNFTTEFPVVSSSSTKPATKNADLAGIAIVLCSTSQAWIDCLYETLQFNGAEIHLCASVSRLHQVLSGMTNVPLIIFHGLFPGMASLIQTDDQIMAMIRRRTHIVSMRLQRLEERNWHSWGINYEVVSEPIRLGAFIAMIKILAAEWISSCYTPANTEQINLKPLQILFAEDDKLSALIQLDLLEKAGHTVRHAENGKTALQWLQTNHADIILLDLEMPIMNGYELASAIRNGEAGEEKKFLPMVALTAHNTDSDYRHSQLLGISAFLTKPFFPQSLLQTIDRVVAMVTKVDNSMSSQTLSSGLLNDHISSKGFGATECKALIKLVDEGNVEHAEQCLIKIRQLCSDQAKTELGAYVLRTLFGLRRKDLNLAKKTLDELDKYMQKFVPGGIS